MATPEIVGGVQPIGENTGIPAYLHRPLAASEQVGRGQFVTVNLSTGFSVLNDGATPNQACAGLGDPSHLSDVSTIAGAASVRLSQRWHKGAPDSTASNDGFADTDFGRTFFIADENYAGKLSNLSGANRSMGGICFGLGEDGNPILWSGPVAWLLARATHQSDATLAGSYAIADAAANAATAERAIERNPVHGVVTAVQFIGAGITEDATNYATITISKRDGAGGSAVVVATYSTETGSNGTITAFTPASFTLSAVAGALNLLETDILTITVAKAASGQSLIGNIRIVQKVI